MLADVRSIIAEQLGTDLEKVRRALLTPGLAGPDCNPRSTQQCLPQPPHLHLSPRFRHSSAPQVAAESKFVDLGADSLDTVEIMMALEEKFDIQVGRRRDARSTSAAACGSCRQSSARARAAS